MSGRRKLIWRNHSRDRSCHPRSIEHLETTDQLVGLVRRAESENAAVRPVGAGHAWSDVALTDGYLIETDRMTGLLPLDDGTLRDAARDDPHLVRVKGGTRVRELNTLLDARQLALRNMGGYDAQSIAGVVATSTHGSGIRFGPFPDDVRSLDLVVSGGELVRVEPEGGITDPDRYAGRGTLVQDDDAFASAICGIGCLGIVDSLVLQVRSEYWLHEQRRVRTWEEVRGELAGGVLDRHDRLSRLFVRYVWRPIQRRTGYSATSPSRDYALRAKHDRAMYEWARRRSPGLVLIAGHTHRPVFARSTPEPPPTRPIAELEEALRLANAGGDAAAAAAVRAELEYARTGRRRPDQALEVKSSLLLQHGLLLVPRRRCHGS